ncbi:MAG: AAA family ATPase [Phycisphaeraceae bacterium]|nr:AAA family ATPase [Phycisphaeraceae bacterium]
MRTIAIINQKGGCGKTTVSINLAATLAARGHKTLLVDMDPQGHCALGLAVPEKQIGQSISDLLRHGMDGQIGIADIVWQISRQLDLAPATVALAGIEQRLANAADRDRRLIQVLAPAADRYDYCIIDCPPSIGLLTFNALRAADEVIVPVETGYFAMQGSYRQEQTIEALTAKIGHNVRFKVLPTLYDVRTKLAREILSELKKHFGDKLLPHVINFNAKLKEAASFGQPITEYDGASRGMKDFDELANWLIANPPLKTALPSTAEIAAQAGANQSTPGRLPQPPRNAPFDDNANVSRAAELVERARELSARTAQLTQRLNKQTADQGVTQPQPPTPQPETAIAPAVAAAPTANAAVRPVSSAVQPPVERPGLQEKLNKLYGIRQTHKGTLFVQPGEGCEKVGIAGDFNNWNPASTPMSKHHELGVWQTCIEIPPGRYRYRLVIDGQWVKDPYNPATETNPFGELNSVLEVG